MRTTFVMDPPPIVEHWLERRRALDQDRYDEVWEGEYHVAPAASGPHARVDHLLARILGPLADRVGLVGGGPCNIGTPGDYRVPDQAYIRDWQDRTWYPTAAIVVEIVSPDDESRAKLGFFFRVGVEEVLIVDPSTHTVEWLERGPEAFRSAAGSTLLGITGDELVAAIAWPT
ncbi:MAG: Uma2 family endonuclease [Chloroflexi bacterium]|nr:Uma2 family endonuclease [Chloroflexota bacterium]